MEYLDILDENGNPTGKKNSDRVPPPKDNFGVPKVDYSPMGTIGMEGQFFRGMSDSKMPRSLFVRIVIICICILVFLIPGLAYIYFSIAAIISKHEILPMIIPIFLGLVVTGAGLAGIKANIRRK